MRGRRIAITNVVASAVMACALMLALPARAATPPPMVHYQGVLRGANNAPLNGTYVMVFTFYSAQMGGDQIMIDAHDGNAGSPAVDVTNGLFSVALGTGSVSDGSGPGTIINVADVFKFYGDVWLEIRIGSPGETLSPRTRFLPAAYAANAATLEGHAASEFLDTSSTAQSKSGRLTISDPSNTPGYGLTVQSAGVAGVLAQHKTGSGAGYLAYGNIGVWGEGGYSGGFFKSKNATGSVLLGYGDVGVQGDGVVSGGAFTQSNGHGFAYLGQNGIGGSFYSNGTGSASLASGNYGLVASGTYPSGAGGYFTDPYYTGSAYCAIGNTGVVGSGSYQGGEFYDSNNAGHARLGFGAIGVYGIGSNNENFQYGGGGYFEDASGPGTARVGFGSTGIQAYGSSTGGYFYNASGASVYLPYNQTGVIASGPTTGGYYSNFYGTYTNLAYWNGSSAYTIQGNGAKSFVQNHPYDTDKSVVFVALEGDEAGTYTRGQGRTQAGIARVPLSASFGLVTNPDVGLTATVTARGASVPLAIDSLTTSEIVVRAPAGAADVTFDYTVFGLRLGFEAMPIVQPRVDDAPLPSPAAERLDVEHAKPGSALERFAGMRVTTGETRPLDLSRAEALKTAIGIGKEGPSPRKPGGPESPRRPAIEGTPGGTLDGPGAADGRGAAGASPAPPRIGPVQPGTSGAPPDAGRPMEPPVESRFPAATVPVVIEGEVRGGDVVALGSGGSATASPATAGAVPVALGIVAAETEASFRGVAPLALAGSIVRCRADAGGAPIAVGDLLTLSDVPGHARRLAAGENTPIAAKALEPLAEGRGVIRVLAVAR